MITPIFRTQQEPNAVDDRLLHWEQELKHINDEIAVLDNQRSTIMARTYDLRREKHVLAQLITSRKKRLGIAVETTPDDVLYLPGVKNGKSAFVWKLIQEHPGITPATIRKAASSQFKINKTFPYTILGRWKATGRVAKQEAGYFAKGNT